MSRTFTRVLLTVLISIGIIVGTYMTVRAASSPSNATASLGGYVHNLGLSSSLAPQFAPEQQLQQPEFMPGGEGGEKGGCESENIDPSDL